MISCCRQYRAVTLFTAFLPTARKRIDYLQSIRFLISLRCPMDHTSLFNFSFHLTLCFPSLLSSVYCNVVKCQLFVTCKVYLHILLLSLMEVIFPLLYTYYSSHTFICQYYFNIFYKFSNIFILHLYCHNILSFHYQTLFFSLGRYVILFKKLPSRNCVLNENGAVNMRCQWLANIL